MGGKVLERFEHIVDEYHAGICGSHIGIVHHSIGATVLKGFGGKLVAVETGAAEGKEKRAFGAVAGIGRHQRMLLEELVKFRNFHVVGLLLGGNVPEAGGRRKRESTVPSSAASSFSGFRSAKLRLSQGMAQKNAE